MSSRYVLVFAHSQPSEIDHFGNIGHACCSVGGSCADRFPLVVLDRGTGSLLVSHFANARNLARAKLQTARYRCQRSAGNRSVFCVAFERVANAALDATSLMQKCSE